MTRTTIHHDNGLVYEIGTRVPPYDARRRRRIREAVRVAIEVAAVMFAVILSVWRY